MAARKKKPAVDPAQTDIEEAIDAVVEAAKPAVDYSLIKPADLIAEFLKLKAHAEEQSKKFAEYLKPTNTRMEETRQLLHGKALFDKVNGFPTDEGTAYLSTITSHAIDPESSYTNKDGRTSKGRDALLDWLLDYWDDYGSEGMLLGVTKDIVQKWMDDKKDDPAWNDKYPPGLKLDSFKRINIKKS